MRLAPTKPSLLAFLLVAVLAAVPAVESHVRVSRIAIDKVEASADGPYERITGHAFGELDPSEPLNAGITDIQFAPRNAQGKVEYTARFTLTKPLNMRSASGLLWHDLVNRGAPVTPATALRAPNNSATPR